MEDITEKEGVHREEDREISLIFMWGRTYIKETKMSQCQQIAYNLIKKSASMKLIILKIDK